mmetsp:Transcript_20434/g.42881  ORF Transcript_20434/g.42881 Transcript_20434/m.42881 type:complete len:172 (-) Transcript_20434:147-662(-)|eukprot:CAMPEP_0172466152 /NCGR_PEP_ID=MMETSP1065-20121228/55355_1 /TAXON_ID=265537 /ORGANISM="Amphiprora paludosa, Strain CCMP125" /LENGTH=171 /DNA_ID=CAMNT_0013222871 /DNA_START=174 /DNA_END=689 /DNA_ORIENTATION=+
MPSDYGMSRVVVYETEAGRRQQNLSWLRGMNVLDQDFKRFLDQNEDLRQEFNKLMLGQGSKVNNFAGMMFEFAFINRARFAIEQKIELAKCTANITSESIKSDALRKVNSELDYISGLLDRLGSTSVLRESTKQVRGYGLGVLVNIGTEEEHNNGENLSLDNPRIIEDESE